VVMINKQEIEKVLDGLKRMKIAMFNYCIDGERIKPFLDTAISALEKQIPKKPIEQRYVNYEIENELIGHCPSCQLRWDVAYWQRHCSNCGQKLDWRVEE